MSMVSFRCCSICGARADTHTVGYAEGGPQSTRPYRFVYSYREQRKPLGLCNACFTARRFDGFTAEEIAYFHEEFGKSEDFG